jgi:hypothetical protein
MNILLWILQVGLALLNTMGAVQQLFNYDTLAQQFPIYQALPHGFWIVYGTVSLLGALGLVLTKVGRLVTPIAALVLTVQGLLFAGLTAHYDGFTPSVFAWAMWTLVPSILTAFIAYARFTAKPQTPQSHA